MPRYRQDTMMAPRHTQAGLFIPFPSRRHAPPQCRFYGRVRAEKTSMELCGFSIFSSKVAAARLPFSAASISPVSRYLALPRLAHYRLICRAWRKRPISPFGAHNTRCIAVVDTLISATSKPPRTRKAQMMQAVSCQATDYLYFNDFSYAIGHRQAQEKDEIGNISPGAKIGRAKNGYLLIF